MGEKAVDTADTEGKAKNKEKTTASQIALLLRPFAQKRGKAFVKYAENKNIKKAKLDVDKILEATPMLAKLKTLKDQKFKQSDLESAMAKLVKDSYTYPYIYCIYIERDFDIYLYIHIYIYMYT